MTHATTRIAALGALLITAAAGAQEYRMILVEPWNTEYDLAVSGFADINNHNVATGCATPYSGPCSFIWTLDGGKVVSEIAGPINDLGVIASDISILYPDGELFIIPDITEISGLNNNNVVAGAATSRYWGGCRYTRTAKVWDEVNGTRSLIDLGVPDAHHARAINNHNQIVGVRSFTGSCGDFEAFLLDLDSGQHIDIHRELLGDTMGITDAFDINDAGVVVGEGPYGTSIGEAGPFIWSDDDGFTFLPAIPDGSTADTHAYALNNLGTVVGGGIVTDDFGGLEWHAFVWDETRGIRDLNKITLGIPDNFTITSAHGINDNGWIIAYGLYGSWSPERAVVLIPRKPRPRTLTAGQ